MGKRGEWVAVGLICGALAVFLVDAGFRTPPPLPLPSPPEWELPAMPEPIPEPTPVPVQPPKIRPLPTPKLETVRLAVMSPPPPMPPLPMPPPPPLSYAVTRGDKVLCARLLQSGADPDAPADKQFADLIADAQLRHYLKTEPGMTVLMLAAALGDVECVELLLAHGAKRGAVTKRYRMSAFSFAARCNAPPQMLQILLGKSARLEDQRLHVRISLGSQLATLYKDGAVAMVSPVSTGMPEFPTPTGEFVVSDKARRHVSTIYRVEMPFFMRMSGRDFGMHAGELPGYPASHGCIRMPHDLAAQFYKLVDIGTLVTISQ